MRRRVGGNVLESVSFCPLSGLYDNLEALPPNAAKNTAIIAQVPLYLRVFSPRYGCSEAKIYEDTKEFYKTTVAGADFFLP